MGSRLVLTKPTESGVPLRQRIVASGNDPKHGSHSQLNGNIKQGANIVGKWFVIGIAVVAVLGALYWHFPGLHGVAFYTPAMVGTTKLPVFGVSWLLISGVGLAILFKRLTGK